MTTPWSSAENGMANLPTPAVREQLDGIAARIGGDVNWLVGRKWVEFDRPLPDGTTAVWRIGWDWRLLSGAALDGMVEYVAERLAEIAANPARYQSGLVVTAPA